MRTIDEVTLGDLMAEDLDVWVGGNKDFGFELHIDGEDGEPMVRERGVHPFAMDSFADVCRRFLRFYDEAVSV